jgi:predicted TIM-barrel fold metal-dependent hydrolase
MVIDGHVHVWPDKIAQRALGGPSGKIKRFGDGTVADARATMARAGIDRAVCLAVADTADRLDAANRFIGSLPEPLIGFGTVHAGRTPEDNLRSLREHGAKGVKIHPLFQGYGLDDRRLWAVLDALQGEFVCVFHVGPEQPGEANVLATPKMVADIVRAFPRLDVVAAHLGGYHVYEEALEHVIGLPVYLDTSWPPSLASVDPARVRSVIERHGPDRIVFATDWPMADPAEEIAAIEALALSDADTEAILGGNLARLLGL